MAIYLTFLTSVIFVSLVGANSKMKRNRIICFIILYLIALLFLGLRYYVGWDYYAYDRMISGDTYISAIKKQEIISYWLATLSKYSGSSFLFFFINAFITITFVFLTIKDFSKNVWASIVVFICFPLFYLNAFSVVRFFTALAISFYSFRFIKKNKIVPFFFFVTIASGFHFTALICLPFYFLAKIKTKIWVYLIIGIFALAFRVVFFRIVNDFFSQYLVYLSNTESKEGTKAIFFFVAFLFGFIAVIYYRQDFYTKNYKAFNLFFFGVLFYLMFIQQGTLGHRLSLFGTLFSVLLIPNALSFPLKIDKKVLYFVIFTLCIVAFSYTISVGAETYIPYKTIWMR